MYQMDKFIGNNCQGNWQEFFLKCMNIFAKCKIIYLIYFEIEPKDSRTNMDCRVWISKIVGLLLIEIF